MIERIVCSTWSASTVVSSIRVPVGARMWMLDRAGVDRGEEILPEKRREAERQQRDADEAAGEPETAAQRQAEQAEIPLAQSFELMLEPVLKVGEETRSAAVRRFRTRGRMMMLIAQQEARHRRHQRIGQDVGGDHRKDDRHRQRPEEIAGDAAQREQRHEGDADAKQSDRRRAA